MNKESAPMRFLYNTFIGRIFLKITILPIVSKLGGAIMNSRLSKCKINSFAEKNNIDLSEYYCDDFRCFNDFFCRKIHEDLRPIDDKANHLIAPSDGRLSVYKIEDNLVLPVKQSMFSISSLLRDENLAKKYQDGDCLVFRLCVDNYHRYCYIDNGTKEKNTYLKGKFHTVRPIALEKYPVFTENAREYTILHTENFGDVIQIEVGALMVGKIKNLHQEYSFKRGEEKGMFLFGGSTIILLLEKGRVKIPNEYYEKTKMHEEIQVKMGEKIGEKKH